MENKKKKFRTNPFYVFTFIVLITYCISYFFPLFWGLMTSLKNDYALMRDPFGWPKEFHFDNYLKIWKGTSVMVRMDDGSQRSVNLIGMLINSIVFVGGCTFFNLMFPICTSYAASKFSKYAFCRLLYTVAIIVMIIPIVGSLASELRMIRVMGVFDNMLFMCFARGSAFGTNFLLLYAAFKGMPNDYGDAARVDGATEWGILFKIFIPLLKGTLMAISILSIIQYWNDYQTTIVYLPSYPTLAYGLFSLRESFDPIGSQTTIRIAGCFILTFPVFVIFLVFNRYFLQNLSIGGLKG